MIWVHDLADVFLESAKLFKYAGKEGISDALFYSFAISWVNDANKRIELSVGTLFLFCRS